MVNKRGQGLSTNAIVLIILAVVILIILILGFTMGWNNFAPWLSSNNVNNVVSQCEIACSTGSTYDYCSKSIILKADDLPSGQKEFMGNCSYFADAPEYAKYGIEACPGLCPSE